MMCAFHVTFILALSGTVAWKLAIDYRLSVRIGKVRHYWRSEGDVGIAALRQKDGKECVGRWLFCGDRCEIIALDLVILPKVRKR